MKQRSSPALAHQLLQLLWQFPRMRFKKYPVDGLTQGEQALLLVLVMNLGEPRAALTVTELSNLLQITPAGVTHLLNPLEETGHIERLADANDRRIVRVGLTPRGTKAAGVLMRAVQEQLGGVVEYLGEEDSRTLIRLLGKVMECFTQ